MQHQLEKTKAGTCQFVRGARQDSGNLTLPFFDEYIMKGDMDRDTVTRFLKLVKQDYSYSLAKYFVELLDVLHSDLNEVLLEG